MRNTIIKINITGDGATELNKRTIYDASAYDNPTIEQKLWKIEYQLENFSGELYWDGTPDDLIITLDDTEHRQLCEKWIGGLANAHVSGRTGDIILTTKGLDNTAIALLKGYIILYVKHRALKDGTR